jgi:two-component system, OmpR family, phosphate regulon sensor histidine kinase PhoR
MISRRSLRWPITLGVVLIVLVVVLAVGWVVVNTTAALRSEHSAVYWTLLAVGATFFVVVLVGVILYLALSVKAIRLSQRQSNFIDAVTHELKSPIASLKLYVQTLSRRQVTPEQQADFHRFMREDLDRLDQLIDHLLDAARLEHSESADDGADVSLDELITSCARLTCQRYRVPDNVIRLDLVAAKVHARAADLEIIFRNLLDNALKYSGDDPQVEVELHSNAPARVIARITDNGPGIPATLRRKIFGRFVRLGSELERKAPGTGLGLYIVRTLVGRLGGRIQVADRRGARGTVFEVDLPAASGHEPQPPSAKILETSTPAAP